MIDAIYIIKDGICLYSKELEGQLDRNLVAGFLTAINQFALNISDGENIKQVLIGNSTFSFKVKNNLIFVFRLEDAHHSIIKKVTEKIINSFLELYSPYLEKFDGEVTIFKNFDEVVQKILNKDYEIDHDFHGIEFVTDSFNQHLTSEESTHQVKMQEEEVLCRICLMDIDQNTDDIRYCPNGHPVHEDCLLEWIKHSTRCPLCNAEYSQESLTDIKNLSLI